MNSALDHVNDQRDPRQSALNHETAMVVLDAELRRTLTLWRKLDSAQWSEPTECPGWDVKAMALHVLGACKSGASLSELSRQMLAAKRLQSRQGGALEAALSAVQIERRDHLSTDQILSDFEDVIPRVVAGRRRLPSLARQKIKLTIDGPLHETWSLGYLTNTIYLRDLWMHRVDVSRATGHELELTSEHDALVVADVADEWAERHRRPVSLSLAGPAGGQLSYGHTSAGPHISMDAVEFCRALSGRSLMARPKEGADLLENIVPF